MNKQNGKVDERIFEKPVSWLLGRQLMGSLKGTLLYTAFGKKIDPRDWMEPRAFTHGSADDSDEFWFDYIADTGDGMRATYSIAYLSHGSLWTTTASECGDKVVSQPQEGLNKKLPRGEFLVVGGDTTYHLSDYSTLANRFQRPFKWAFEDRSSSDNIPPRPLYAIPGNHDYYDLLDGFRRQFRRPSDDATDLPDARSPAQLVIPGFVRKQEASYVALKLPWNWWFWGLDTELGQIDSRQQRFFDRLNNGQTPDKLIVATCAPTTVFGKYARWSDQKAAQTFFQLKLPWWFWSGNANMAEMKRDIRASLMSEYSDEEIHEKLDQLNSLTNFGPAGDFTVKDGQCRLDLSGDVHLYARYWGPKYSKEGPFAGPMGAMSHDNYASVVSGLGGAFHHPSYTSVKEIKEQVLYPTRQQSLNVVAERILNPWRIATGGSIWLFGIAIAFVMYIGTRVVESSSIVASAFFEFLFQTFHLVTSRDQFGPLRVPIYEGRVSPTWGLSPDVQHIVGVFALAISGVLLVLAAVTGRRYFSVRRATTLAKELPSDRQRRNRLRQNKLRAFVLINAALVLIGMELLRRVQGTLEPFENSLLVLYSLLLGAAAFYFCIEYSEWLFEKAHMDYIRGQEWMLVYLTSFFGLAAVVGGLWYFGKRNYPVGVVIDIVFALIFFGTLIGLPLLSYVKGGELVKSQISRLRLLPVGLWHALLQILVPVLLIVFGTPYTLLTVGFISVIAYSIGVWTLKNRHHKTFTLVWFLYGSAVLLVPFVLLYFAKDPRLEELSIPVLSGRWQALINATFAGLIGAINSCVWFGWYLAFCFLNFQGHNNEVGGAARIENFKQFIRFRLTRDTLTGYVIGVDDVSMIGERSSGGTRKDGRFLEPKLIDVFTLSVKSSSDGISSKG